VSNISFLLEHEEGHLLPTFQLAKRLAARGHNVSYIGLADAADLIERKGFPFAPILEDLFPKGSTRTLRNRIEAAETENGGSPVGYMASNHLADTYVGSLVRSEDLQTAVHTLRPDLFLAGSMFVFNPLVLLYRFQVPVVLITPWLRSFPKQDYSTLLEAGLLRLRGSGMDFFNLAKKSDPTARRLADIAVKFLAMRELILCPKELDLPRPDWRNEQEVFYVEPSIELSRGRQDDFPWDKILPDRRLLYCSLGSQSQIIGRDAVLRFLSATATAATRLPGWQLVMATGLLNPEEIPGLPADAVAARWVPQIPILERASLMITHGGLGTIKECIFHGVPVVVFPLLSDQPENSRRIAHHGLGLFGDFKQASPDEIASLVQQVGENPSFRDNMSRMRQAFRVAEESGAGVQRIEEILERKARTVGGRR
jgi:MGT family glycosyltransferase